MASSSIRLLVAAPTNDLKRELYERAKSEGINAIVSPSLHELDLPDDIRNAINQFYNTGRYRLVVPYLKKIALRDTRSSKMVKKYLDELNEFNDSDCSAIITHKKILYMDEGRLEKYDAVIIDEDVILKAIIPDQCLMPLFELENALKRSGPNSALAKKIKKALKCARTKPFFELPSI
jgi:hypothetical protein